MSKLKYTTERPTAPGAFFYRDAPDDRKMVDVDYPPREQLLYAWCGDAPCGYVYELVGEWAGPIEEPEE